jgi:uncharacterized protein YlxW (UPF0749 family)
MICDDERVVLLEIEAKKARYAKDLVYGEAETHRKAHMLEVAEVRRLQQQVAVLEGEMEYIREQIGETRFAEIVERYHVVNEAALRKLCGYNYTARGSA